MNAPEKDPVYDAQCLVCLKEVREGDELVHFRFEDRFVTLCCPLCFEAFETDPKKYLARQLAPRQPKTSFQ